MTTFISGTVGDDALVGTPGADAIYARGGNDQVAGLAGDDTLGGGEGDGLLQGGEGDDLVDGEGGDDTLEGGDGNDTLTGGDVFSPGGRVVYRGGAGDDLILPYSGFSPGAPETIEGGDGFDRITFNLEDTRGVTADLDLAMGGGTLSNGTTVQGIEAVTVQLRGTNRVLGGDAEDSIVVTGSGNVLVGRGGNDVITAENLSDPFSGNSLNGSDGDDELFALSGIGDTLAGSAGNDTISAFAATDTLIEAGVGDDLVTVDGVGNVVRGGDGLDLLAFDTGVFDGLVVDLAAGRVTRIGFAGDPETVATVSGIEDVRVTGSARIGGSEAANTLIGTGAGDADQAFLFQGLGGDDRLAVQNATAGARLDGGLGDDTLDGSDGGDVLIGGGGRDTATYANAEAAVTADLSSPGANAGEAAEDHYSQVEDLTGSSFGDVLGGNAGTNRIDGDAGDDLLRGLGGADTLLGGEGADTLEGGDKSDRLDGGTGNDVVVGGAGFNTLTGGEGRDAFVFEGLIADGDLILDLVTGEDTLVFEAAGFGVDDPAQIEFLAGGRPSAIEGPTLLYDTVSGYLRFDQDGAGAGEASLVAILEGHPEVTIGDVVWA